MCVIIYKERNKPLPSKDILEKCWDSNSDGAGIMWDDEDLVNYMKGFMNFDTLYEFLQANRKLFEKKYITIHFRKVSRGLHIPEQTHPFPIGKYQEYFQKYDDKNGLIYGVSESALVHNGTMTTFGSALKSDTQELSEWLTSLQQRNVSDEILFKEILPKVGNNGKFIVMTKGKVILVGDFKEKYGFKFSNLYWEYKPQYLYHGYNYNQSNLTTPSCDTNCDTDRDSTLLSSLEEKKK